MEKNKFEVGKTYINLSEYAGQMVERRHPQLPLKKQFYVPKEITITACTGSFYKAVDDKGNELSTDNKDRRRYVEKQDNQSDRMYCTDCSKEQFYSGEFGVEELRPCNTFDNFIEELVTEIMGEIYFDDISETTCTLDWFEVASPMYEIKKQDIINLVKEKFKDKTVIEGKPLN